jgi:hypothetical protein
VKPGNRKNTNRKGLVLAGCLQPLRSSHSLNIPVEGCPAEGASLQHQVPVVEQHPDSPGVDKGAPIPMRPFQQMLLRSRLRQMIS